MSHALGRETAPVSLSSESVSGAPSGLSPSVTYEPKLTPPLSLSEVSGWEIEACSMSLKATLLAFIFFGGLLGMGPTVGYELTSCGVHA